MQQEQPAEVETTRQERTTYWPPNTDRLLSYVTSPKMKYRERTAEEKAGLVHCSHIKMIVNDVAFLTEKATPGDIVIYVGGTIGAYMPIVARMFPTLQFLVYDGNPTSLHYQRASEDHPPNMHLKPVWFNDQEAMEYTQLQQPKYDPRKTLIMVDARNVTRNPVINIEPSTSLSTKVNRSSATEENVLKDMHEQETWMHILKPRSALLKFRLPFDGDANYSYLKGKMYLQTFAQKSSTEVRLCIDAPANPASMYPRDLYNADMHEAALFYHNCVTRRLHLGSGCNIKVSWDQHASHKVLEQWIEKALQTDEISGIGLVDSYNTRCFIYTHKENAINLREAFVRDRINLLDSLYGRTLGCRVNPNLKQYVQQDNHVKKRAIVDKLKEEKRLRYRMRNQEHQLQDDLLSGGGEDADDEPGIVHNA